MSTTPTTNQPAQLNLTPEQQRDYLIMQIESLDTQLAATKSNIVLRKFQLQSNLNDVLAAIAVSNPTPATDASSTPQS